MTDFLHLNKPKPSHTTEPFWYVVEAGYPFYGLYLLNTGILSAMHSCKSPMTELYYDNESEAYAAMYEYYEFNKQPFPYFSEMSKAVVKDGHIELPSYVTRVSEVESEVMEFI
jgi:hypothetical protein